MSHNSLKREAEDGSAPCIIESKTPRLDADAQHTTTAEIECNVETQAPKADVRETVASLSDVAETGVPQTDVNTESPQTAMSTSDSVDDPLNYTHSQDFTSEIYKIQITNTPRFGFGQLKKRLRNLGLHPHKIKRPDGQHVTYVCFRNESDRQEALLKIKGHVWKGKKLDAKVAAPVADPFLKLKIQKAQQNSSDGSKNNSVVDLSNASPEEAEASLKSSIVPLWNMDYEEQLQLKTSSVKNILSQICLDNFLKEQFRGRILPCELLPVIPSPVQSEYRNKNEFTIGYDMNRKIKVGFRYGLYKDGTTTVGECTKLGIAMPDAVPVIESFEKFVSASPFPPFQQQTQSGHWQTLTVRTFTSGDVMVMVDFVPRNLSNEEIDSAKNAVKEFYTNGSGKDVRITSFYFRTMASKGQDARNSNQLLFGEQFVYEKLLGYKYRVSPEAFFQVNTLATEGLYRLIEEWSQVTSQTTLLDVCCGTGTIGLSLAKNARQVVGIEMSNVAVQDAKVNAEINGITNAVYHCSKVEEVIARIVSSIEGTGPHHIVAVVDPPRAGLHKTVVRTLRRCLAIERLVYVSCSPHSAKQNFIDLIRPATGKHGGEPFTMVKARPVDLFPGTKHCELVLLLTRSRTNSTATQ